MLAGGRYVCFSDCFFNASRSSTYWLRDDQPAWCRSVVQVLCSFLRASYYFSSPVAGSVSSRRRATLQVKGVFLCGRFEQFLVCSLADPRRLQSFHFFPFSLFDILFSVQRSTAISRPQVITSHRIRITLAT